MTAQPGTDDDRQVIPRWRSFKRTLGTRELASLAERTPDDVSGEIEELRSDFGRTHELYVAADLISGLYSQGAADAETRELALRIRSFENAPPALLSLIDDMEEETPESKELAEPNGDDSLSSASQHVRELRTVLLRESRNAIRWVYLALAHATLGENTKATREMTVALGLAPDSRFVLRSAARLYVHVDDPEQANRLLARSARLRSDPWLLAAELSTSQLAFGKFHQERAARELLLADLSPHSISEMASEIASNEVRHGRDKRAREIFGRALEQPTENSVAQAASVADKGDLRLDAGLLQIARGYEARAINFSRRGDWAKAAQEGQRWHQDQPFAVEPAVFTSYAAAVGDGDFSLGLAVAKAGLQTHPEDSSLRNNAAFSAAMMSNVVEARSFMAGVDVSSGDVDSYVHLATQGLIAIREGQVALGRADYNRAIAGLNKLNRRDLSVVATLLLALEERRLGTGLTEEIRKRAIQAVRLSPTSEAETLLQKLLTEDRPS